MKLIGMLNSPYVRRVAVSLQLLGLRFEHQSLSVFQGFAEFQEINPVVKAPTLVCDDGEVMMDSTLILAYAEALAAPGRSLMPAGITALQHTLVTVGLALAACEKSVQIVYERKLRPAEKLHQPWVDRVAGQLHAAYDKLEARIARRPPAVTSADIDQAGVSIAVAWQFTQQMIPDVVGAENYPRLRELSVQAEALPAFLAAPHGAGTFRQPD